MPRIDALFRIHRGRSDLFGRYSSGPVAYVSNLSEANGVLGFVTPKPADAVFDFTGIVLNSFSRMPHSCGARMMRPPFIASSRSGNGLLVLEPLTPMDETQLTRIAAHINIAHGFRFTWYRQATRDRVAPLEVPGPEFSWPTTPALDLIPKRGAARRLPTLGKQRLVPLEEIFNLVPGEYHAVSHLRPGKVPVISCADEQNGVVGHYEIPSANQRSHLLTIAFNGRPLTTKFHHYAFAAKDDVAVALPRRPLALESLLYIKLMLDSERWRYSYYRKCYIEKLGRFEVRLPVSRQGLDERFMAGVLASSPYWSYISARLQLPGAISGNVSVTAN